MVAVAKQHVDHMLNKDSSYLDSINKSHQCLTELLANAQPVYGVTTGFGDSVGQQIHADDAQKLALNLVKYHNCGLGRLLDAESTRAVLLTRLCSLATGYSGISYSLLEHLSQLLTHDILPRIPEEGSVGASGDLTPLSYIAAVLCGDGQVLFQQQDRYACEIFAELGLAPYKLQPKESLSLMNGTSVMTGLACLAYDRARYLIELAQQTTAMLTMAMLGNAKQFSANLFAVKPHPGQQAAAASISALLNKYYRCKTPYKLQDS